LSSSREQLESWLKTIDIFNVCVVDIGGAQKPVKGRTRSWKPKNYDILDLDNPHEVKAGTKWRAGDIQSFNEGGKYDVAFCLEVSEYWHDPLSALKNIASLLKKGGTLFISFHFIYCIHSPVGKDYLRYTPDGAKRLLLEAGFTDVIDTPRVGNMKLIDFYDSERMKGFFNNVIGSLIKCKKL
jgi:SAM-dependent methyltransferase